MDTSQSGQLVAVEHYFAQIASYSATLLDRLPISSDIEPIRDTFARLLPAIEQRKSAEISQLDALMRPRPVPPEASAPVGMNSVGILADRLSILVCKEWYLRNRQYRPSDAAEIVNMQIPDIVRAMAHAHPGHPRLLEKVSAHQSVVTAASFHEAYYGIFAANILMWETQEMLYVRDMNSVAAEDLRDYIQFFMQANMMRNAYIAQCEGLYWRPGASNAVSKTSVETAP